jgi:hypothetical protein
MWRLWLAQASGVFRTDRNTRAMALDADDRLRLDYDQTTQYLRTLIDVRFKLLAFVPTVSGIAVAIVGRPRPAAELLGVGVLGLLATLGIFVYELRNTQISGTLIRRAAELERRLQLPSSLGGQASGGLYTERPGITVQLLGFLPVSHGLGLGLVYSAAIAGWSYLVAWGGLKAVDTPEAQAAGAALGAVAGVIVLFEVERFHRHAGWRAERS